MREPMTPWARQLREMTIVHVRAVFSTSSTWQQAADRIGTRYETIYHWRQACPELGGLKTTESPRAEQRHHGSSAIAKGRKRARSRKSRTSVS